MARQRQYGLSKVGIGGGDGGESEAADQKNKGRRKKQRGERTPASLMERTKSVGRATKPGEAR